MVSSKISELQPATTLSGPELVPIVQTGNNKRTTVGDIAAMVAGMSDKCRFFKNLSTAAFGGVIFNDGLSFICTAIGNTGGTMGASVPRLSGKYYFEVRADLIGQSLTPSIGICQEIWSGNQLGDGGLPSDLRAGSWSIFPTGTKYSGASTESYGTGFNSGDTVMVAVDLDAHRLWFGSGGAWKAGGDPVAGTGAAYTNVSGYVYPAVTCAGGATVTANFAGPFAFTPPAGFSAWDS